MPNQITKYRGRFAPSPSGSLHFGSLVAALGSYVDARHCQGEWFVRIENLDPPREKPGAATAILKTLEAFGFEWDGEVLYQGSQIRQYAYQQALDRLSTLGVSYGCVCSRREISGIAAMGVAGPIYPGTCRSLPSIGRDGRAVRIRTDERLIEFHDLIRGHQKQFIGSESGDFIVRRADGYFAYQLAVVIDDAFQEISRVVRGADLLLSTPRQLYLQQLLGLPTPAYAHLPLVRDIDGRKLSKESMAQPVKEKEPLTTLNAAWKFLGQSPIDPQPESLEQFWSWTFANWDISKVPVDTILPAQSSNKED